MALTTQSKISVAKRDLAKKMQISEVELGGFPYLDQLRKAISAYNLCGSIDALITDIKDIAKMCDQNENCIYGAGLESLVTELG